MGLMKSAFDAACKIHSSPGFLKRQGTPDIYSSIRITPSNYFRYLAGVSHTVVTGSEVVIPTATILGQQSATVSVDAAPSAGTFTISFYLDGDLQTTADINFDAISTDIQSALRLIAGCENVTVSGDILSTTFTVDFIGIKQAENISVDISGLTGVATATYSYSNIAWPDPPMKRGDRILDTNAGKSYTAKEVIELPDLGGGVMGYRIRIE